MKIRQARIARKQAGSEVALLDDGTLGTFTTQPLPHPKLSGKRVLIVKGATRSSARETLLATSKYRQELARHVVNKPALHSLMHTLGVNQAQAINIAITHLIRDLKSTYAADDGPLSDAQVEEIRAKSGVDQNMEMTSTLFG